MLLLRVFSRPFLTLECVAGNHETAVISPPFPYQPVSAHGQIWGWGVITKEETQKHTSPPRLTGPRYWLSESALGYVAKPPKEAI